MGMATKSPLLLRFVLWIALALVVPNREAGATDVSPVEKNCPVCHETFVVMNLLSYFQAGESPRDLSDEFQYHGVTTCPFCLYSAFESDFSNPTESEKAALREFLKDSCLKLTDVERSWLAPGGKPQSIGNDRILQALLARACYRMRGENPGRDVKLARYLCHCAHTGEDGGTLEVQYRREAIAIINSRLDEHAVTGGEEAVYTYLKAELCRLEGNTNEALRSFDLASELVRSLPPQTGRVSCGTISYGWVPDWAYEQSCRIRFQGESIKSLAARIDAGNTLDLHKPSRLPEDIQRKVAIQTLAERSDSESWTELVRFIMQDPANLIEVDRQARMTSNKLRSDSALWTWIANQYDRACKDVNEKGLAGNDTETWIRNRFRWRMEGTSSGEPDDEPTLSKALPVMLQDGIFRVYSVLPGDTMSSVATVSHTTVARLMSLNPHVTNADMISKSMELRLLKVPDGWTETKVIDALYCVLKRGDPVGFEYFDAWSKTLDRTSISKNYYSIKNCFSAIMDHPELLASWRRDPTTESFLQTCLAYLAGDAEAVFVLRQLALSPDPETSSVAKHCFAINKDLSIKESMLDILRTRENADAFAYLVRVMGNDDRPQMVALAMSGNDWDRERKCNLLRWALLNDLLRRSVAP